MSDNACPLFVVAYKRDVRGAKTVGALCLQCGHYDLDLHCCIAPPQAMLKAEEQIKSGK